MIVAGWRHRASFLLGRSTLTRRLAIPFFCQVPLRNSGLLLRLPITFDDGLMSEASQRRTSFLPSRYDTSIHASLVSSKASRKSAEFGGSRVIGRVGPCLSQRVRSTGGALVPRDGTGRGLPSSASFRAWTRCNRNCSTNSVSGLNPQMRSVVSEIRSTRSSSGASMIWVQAAAMVLPIISARCCDSTRASASPTACPLPTLSGERYSRNRCSTTLGS